MPGFYKSFVALLACLVVVGCSAAPEPSPEASAGEAGAAASATPEILTGVEPGDEVDADELLNTVSDAVSGVTTLTMTYFSKTDNLHMEYRYVFDVSDPDNPRGSKSYRSNSKPEVEEHFIDGDTQLVRVGDGKFQRLSEESKKRLSLQTLLDWFPRLSPLKGHVSKAVFVGEEQVGDFAAWHYELAVDSTVFGVDPVDGDKIDYGLWLNSDNLPVKATYSGVLSDVGVMEFEFIVESYEPVDIQMPEASEIEG